MSKKAAEIYERARQNDISAKEAWERLRELAAEYDWGVEQMLQ